MKYLTWAKIIHNSVTLINVTIKPILLCSNRVGVTHDPV